MRRVYDKMKIKDNTERIQWVLDMMGMDLNDAEEVEALAMMMHDDLDTELINKNQLKALIRRTEIKVYLKDTELVEEDKFIRLYNDNGMSILYIKDELKKLGLFVETVGTYMIKVWRSSVDEYKEIKIKLDKERETMSLYDL